MHVLRTHQICCSWWVCFDFIDIHFRFSFLECESVFDWFINVSNSISIIYWSNNSAWLPPSAPNKNFYNKLMMLSWYLSNFTNSITVISHIWNTKCMHGLDHIKMTTLGFLPTQLVTPGKLPWLLLSFLSALIKTIKVEGKKWKGYQF